MNKVITIDGPSSSGKTSVGYQFSRQIGYGFVDAGTIYRAGCLKIIEMGFEINDPGLHAVVFENLDISFVDERDKQRVLLSGIDITEVMNNKKVTEIVPIIGAGSCVRSTVKRILRTFAIKSDILVTGRDMGTEIFPEAFLKFYFTADPEVRATRRYQQLIYNDDESADYGLILSQILQRDEKDSNREVSPMRIPGDAVIIDSSFKTIGEVLSVMNLELELRQVEFLNNA